MTLIRVRQPGLRRYDPFAGKRPGQVAPAAGGLRASTVDHLVPAPLVLVPAEGTQVVGSTVPKKLASCEEAGCRWFFEGREGEDEGAPFSHPAGAHCGDHGECTHPNCPCPQNLTWEMRNGVLTGVRGHLIPDHNAGPTWRVNTGQGMRITVQDEILTRLHEGTDTIEFIQKRGL